MSITRRFATLLALPIACALCLAAAPADAAPRGERPPAGSEERPRPDRPERGPNKDQPAFPMEAAAFKQKVAERIERIGERLERAMAKRDLPPGIERQIRADFARGAGLIRAAADKAAADGTVTKDEARRVRELARELRSAAREKYGAQARPRKPRPRGRG